MRMFTDLKGREWELSLNGWTLERVKEGTNVLLTKIVEDNCKVLAAIHEDPLLLVSIIWYMIEDQAKTAGVDKKDFAMAMAGDVIFNAKSCLIEETINFFDDPATRRNVKTLIDKSLAIATQIQKETEEKLEGLNPQSMARGIIDSYGSLPGSAALSRGGTL